MEAGRELDAEVAIKVMGWRRVHWREWMRLKDPAYETTAPDSLLSWWVDTHNELQGNAEDLSSEEEAAPPWSPSTDIAAAWQVVEHFRAEDMSLEVIASPDEYRARVGLGPWSDAGTAPLAICLATLAARATLDEE